MLLALPCTISALNTDLCNGEVAGALLYFRITQSYDKLCNALERNRCALLALRLCAAKTALSVHIGLCIISDAGPTREESLRGVMEFADFL
jgi:hypothetical protein